jgi:oligoendopeptidase F
VPPAGGTAKFDLTLFVAEVDGSLRATLDQLSAVNQRLRRLWTYASALASTDNRNPRHQERSGQARAAWGQINSATAWVTGAIRALGAERIDAYVRAEPGLARHRVRMQEALRLARHQLAPEAETALAAMGPALGATTQIRTLMVTTDIEWPTLTVEGRPVLVDNIGYQRLRTHPDRAVRQQAFEAFFKTYGRFQGSLGAALAQRVEVGVAQARLRQHPSAVAASLAVHAIPESVYRTLVAETNRALPTLHRYFKLRQRLLKLPDLAYHDVTRSRGLFYLLERHGKAARVTHDPAVFEAKSIPPQTTRARLRGEFIRRAQERRRDFTVDWVHLKLNDQAQRTVLCKDPFASVDERVEKLIASM